MEFEGDVAITSDHEVVDYYAYDKINGNLTFVSSDATSIPLPELKEVTGNVIIQFNDMLSDISGLEALSTIGGDLIVENNDALSTEAVEKLRDRIQNGGGIQGTVTISGNLEDSVAGGMVFEGDAKISSNSDCLMFAAFEKIKGKLTIKGLHVTSVKLPRLKHLEGDLEVIGTGLRSLGGLSDVAEVTGEIAIMDNSHLRDAELSELTKVGKSLIVRDNPSMDSITGLAKLSDVGEDLEVVFNRNLPNIEAEMWGDEVKGRGSISGTLTIGDNMGY